MKLFGKNISLFVYDFDGIMTDNKALLFSNGDEAVFINRSDGLAIEKIKSLGISQIIISTETNSIIVKRAEKLGIDVINGVKNKLDELKIYISNHNNISVDEIAFVGNDLNDLDVMNHIGLKISPKDAADEILAITDYVTSAKGGAGVIREIYSKILEEN